MCFDFSSNSTCPKEYWSEVLLTSKIQNLTCLNHLPLSPHTKIEMLGRFSFSVSQFSPFSLPSRHLSSCVSSICPREYYIVMICWCKCSICFAAHYFCDQFSAIFSWFSKPLNQTLVVQTIMCYPLKIKFDWLIDWNNWLCSFSFIFITFLEALICLQTLNCCKLCILWCIFCVTMWSSSCSNLETY